MRKRRMNGLILAFVIITLCAVDVSAAGDINIAGAVTNESTISLYVKGLTSEITGTECQIGTKAGQTVSYENVLDMSNAPKTLVMIDNSLSITQKNREKITAILKEIVDDKEPTEQLGIATFSEELTPVLDFTAEDSAILSAIDGITYNDQETYLTDVLYDVIAKNYMGEDDCFKRIIIISDGVDNKAIGYTKDELYELMKKTEIPIYTLGCIYKSNNEQLENMFAISRLTGAMDFILDKTDDTDALVDTLAADNQVVHFLITPQKEEMDGSTKNVLLTIQTAEGELKVEAGVKMPYTVLEEAVEVVEEVQPTLAPTEEPIIEDEEPFSFLSSWMIWILIGVLVVAAIAVTIVIICISRKKKNNFEVLQEPLVFSNPYEQSTEKTEILTPNRKVDDDSKTEFVWGDNQIQNTLYLSDVKNPSRTFSIPIIDSVIIGRKADSSNLVIDYDKSISGKHCQISRRNGKFYIKDLQSSNGTFMNGTRILTEMELISGCIVKLGGLQMRVEIR